MIGLRNAVSMRARVMWVRAFMNTYKRRVIAAGGYIEGEQCAIDKINGNNILKEASWRLIPEGIEEDIVFAQKPTNGTGDLSFTRASDATRTNSAGVIERTPWNLFTWSEMFSDVAWTKQFTSVLVNTTTAPNGTLTADTFSGDGTNSIHTILQSVTLQASRSYSISLFVKKGTNDFIQIGGGGVLFGAEVYANFDLNTGTIGNKGTLTTAQIENYGNGWYRCSITGTTIAAATNTGLFATLVNSNTSARGESNTLSTNVILWGAQLVEGTDAKPYFATTNRQDVPRLDYRNADGSLNSCPRLLLEPQRTNSIRNSTMVGAVAGSPGTLPTNWSVIGGAGLTQTIVGTGTESGLTYLDVRYNGTATSTDVIRLTQETNTGIAASNGQTWSLSPYVKVTIASGATPSYSLRMAERTAIGSLITVGTQSATFTSTLTRQTYTRTLIGGGTVGAVVPEIGITVTNGAAYDFTIRIAAPQMELGAYATTFIPTTTAAVTRLADSASKTGVASLIGQTEGTLFLDAVLTKDSTTGFLLQVSDGTQNNRVQITLSTILAWQVTGSNLVGINGTIGFTDNTRLKMAFAYKSGDSAFYINGVKVTSTIEVSLNVPTALNRIDIARNHTSAFPVTEQVNQAALFPTRLANDRLAELTTL
jgi:hypothetical protein